MLVTRHITEIVNYIKKFNESQTVSPTKPVLKKSSNEDEIDYLLENIHTAFTKISDYNQAQVETIQQKDHQLEEHIQKSYLSAKLASIGEMAGGIAHEINNPLAIIDGNISIVERMIDQDKPDKSNIRKRIKKIQQQKPSGPDDLFFHIFNNLYASLYITAPSNSDLLIFPDLAYLYP